MNRFVRWIINIFPCKRREAIQSDGIELSGLLPRRYLRVPVSNLEDRVLSKMGPGVVVNIVLNQNYTTSIGGIYSLSSYRNVKQLAAYSTTKDDKGRSQPKKLINVDLGDSPIGSGGYGVVFCGTWEGRPVALKRLHMSRRAEKLRKRFLRESLIWKDQEHPNILPFYGIYTDPRDPDSSMYMISPWRANGNLKDFLEKRPRTNRMKMLIGIASALEYLHGRNRAVVHGDLRAVNVLITDKYDPQLADFGLASVVHDPTQGEPDLLSADTTTANRGGALRWMAPELFDGDHEQRPRFTPESDVYSLAMLVIEMFTSTHLFPYISNNWGIPPRVLNGERPARPPPLQLPLYAQYDPLRFPKDEQRDVLFLGDELWDQCVTRCWAQDPSERPSAGQLVSVMGTFQGPRYKERRGR